MRIPRCFALVSFAALPAFAQTDSAPAAAAASPSGPIVLQIDAAKVTAHVSPTLYGLMTEEINFSYDGGLYAELIRNRTFQDDAEKPVHWSLVQDNGGAGSIALDKEQPLNSALPVSLKLEATATTGDKARVGVANDGFWGIPVKPNTSYRVSFYARAAAGFSGSLNVSLESNDGAAVHATAKVTGVGAVWKKYSATLRTGSKATPSVANRFVVSSSGTGTVWLNLVSVFPPTWKDRPNGNRVDIMQLLADMKPRFLRFPGGNYLQGKTLATRFDWKKTLGDISERPGHLNDAWNYRSSDGMGLLEFLEWCEDLKIEPVLGVFAGFTLGGKPTPPGPELQVFVDEALEEIEYVIGDTSTKWGARRAKDGHPAPFPLTYVEVGNEDFFDRTAKTYDGRYKQFFDAIKAKYPKLQVIATTKVEGCVPDVVDEHFYPRTAQAFQADVTRYDSYDRKGPKIFVGEWATRIGSPTPNLAAAIGDAAWMTGMERNSDIVVMHAYAPLFVNVSDIAAQNRAMRSMQWATDLIGYDALTSYGSPSYYAQKMFANAVGDVVLGASVQNVPTEEWQPPRPRGLAADAPSPPKKAIPTFFHVTTRDTPKGVIFVKLVNASATRQTVRVEVDHAKLGKKGKATVLTSANLADTNSITEPTKIVPVTSDLAEVALPLTRELAPYSITVLELSSK